MPDGCSPLSFGLLRFGIRLRCRVSLFLLVGGKLVLAFELQLEFDLLEFRSQFILGDRFAQSFSLCVVRAVEIVLCLVILVGQKYERRNAHGSCVRAPADIRTGVVLAGVKRLACVNFFHDSRNRTAKPEFAQGQSPRISAQGD